MNTHNIPQENKQSRLMDIVDHIDERFPDADKLVKKFSGAVLALTLLGGGAGLYNEFGPRTPVDEKHVDVSTLDYGTARNIVLGDTQDLAETNGININDIKGVNDTTASLRHENGAGNVQLLKKPFAGYVVSAETTNNDPANIPAQPDQQNK